MLSVVFYLLLFLLSWEDCVCTASVSATAVVQADYFCYPPTERAKQRDYTE